MSQFSYRDLEMKVIQWSEARKIIPNSTPVAQTRKTAEETTELVEAATKLKVIADMEAMFPALTLHRVDGTWGKFRPFLEYKAKAMDEFKDAVGDILVTCINACALADVDMVDCLEGAYDEIKNRRGTLMPNGIFVKEA